MDNLKKLGQKETDNWGNNKISKFKWTMKNERGVLQWVSKDLLFIDESYQRKANRQKVSNIGRNWSWVGCGALICSERNGKIVVIDGQHRALAAKSRSDIDKLPCVVFKNLETVEKEAEGFIDANVVRNPLRMVEKFHALVIAGDEIAQKTKKIVDELGLNVGAVSQKGSICCVATLMYYVEKDESRAQKVAHILLKMAEKDNMYFSKILLSGLSYVDRVFKNGLDRKRILGRVLHKGAAVLEEAARKAAAYHGGGGEKIFGEGMIIELNKGLRKPLGGEDDE